MKMKFILLLISITLMAYGVAQQTQQNVETQNNSSKSAFGPAFDEIVVESSLTVRNTGRQGKNQNTTQLSKKQNKREINRRQIKPFGESQAQAQAQAFNSFGPLGSFGASATGAQSQSLQGGPGGLFGSAGFSGTQQYMFNGQTIDIAFGNSFASGDGNDASAGATAITVTGPDGKKIPLQG